MFVINNKADYGLLVVQHLSKKQEFLPLSRLIADTKLPGRFVARIASDLVKHGILESREGKIGGYKLKKSLHEISLIEFLGAFEKRMYFTKCYGPDYVCRFVNICTHKKGLQDVLVNIMATELSKRSLADIM